MNELDTKQEKVKGIDYKKVFLNLITLEEPSNFLYKVNKIFVSICLIITLLGLFYTFLKMLFLNIKFAIIILIVSPFIFFFVKYFLAVYLIFIDWLNASLKYYKSNIKKD